MASRGQWRSWVGWLNVRVESTFLSARKDIARLDPRRFDQFTIYKNLCLLMRKVAKRKTLFDDRPVEINELTYVIKQDLSSLNSQISSLQSLSKSQQTQTSKSGAEQEGEHNKNVCTTAHIRGMVCLLSIRSLYCCKANLPT